MADDQSAPQGQILRTEDFVTQYSNHVLLEQSAFDLKLTFGIIDQRKTPADIEQHTAIILSWPEAKLLLYWIQINVALFEKENGKIKIPTNALPPEVSDPPPDPFNTPEGRAAFDVMRKMRADFLANL